MKSKASNLRIMQVVGTQTGGSWFLDQVTTLAGLGHEVLAVVPGEGDLAVRLRAAGIDTRIVEFKGKSIRSTPRLLRAQIQLIRLIREFKPDVLHSHLLKAVLVGRVAGLIGRVPIRVSQWPGSVHLDVRTFRWLDKGTMWIDHAVIGSCTSIAEHYSSLGKRRVFISFYGCHVHRIDPHVSGSAFRQEFSIGDDEATVGMVAHMYPTNLAAYQDIGVKGHEVFIDAAKQVLETHPNTRFFVVGDELVGDGSYRRRLEERALKLGLDECLLFTGHRNDVPRVMAAMDVLVNPSLSESASYTMIEALLMKKGVVASNVGGLPDTIQHEETGLLVPPRDAEALADAIRRQLDEPDKRREMAAIGRDRVLEKFDINNTVDGLVQIYQRLHRMGDEG